MGIFQKLFYSFILPPPQKLRWASSILILPLILQLSCSSPTEPNDNIPPGRRDYVWIADTLWNEDWFGISEVWGDSPNSIWVVAGGTSAKDCLWYYDGVEWTKSNQILSPGLNTVFGVSSEEIWIGDSFGAIWRNTGSGWSKFKQLSISGFGRVVITSIYGIAKNNLYAVGFADNNPAGDYKGIILRYDGKEWNFTSIPDIRVGFEKIKRMSNGKYLISAMNVDSGWLSKIFVFDGAASLKEIYSDYYYPGLNQIKDEVYITIDRKIYKCKNDKLELWKEFLGSGYYGTVLGRSEKDFFGSGLDGILHYNGTDLANLYQTQQLAGLSGTLIFEKDVFFGGYTSESRNIMIRGTLKEE